MIFYGYAVFIKILSYEISPSPLSVVAVAKCAGTHGRVSYQKQYRVVSFA